MAGPNLVSPVQGNVLQLFEEQASLHPEKGCSMLMVWKHLSYREINRRANRLAHYLGKAGYPEGFLYRHLHGPLSGDDRRHAGSLKVRYGICTLDPDYPETRIGYMLADAQPAAVLTLERSGSSACT